METVELVPAKKFFVEMLTRDIELVDAILDLIDNCLDGATRILHQTGNMVSDRPYEGFNVEISFDEKQFKISDNCGGIPRQVALKSAFRMGRHDRERDKDLPTVGVYGIGMKRAIFKMGEDAYVECHTDQGAYKVEITRVWMQDDRNWRLPLVDIDVSGEDGPKGTVIEIRDIREGISRQLGDHENFYKELRDIVSTHYSYIIQKGLQVRINDEMIEPSISITQYTKDFSNKHESIAPYIYRNNFDGVDVEVAIGFYRSLGTDREENDEKAGKSVSTNAGITIVCNDRVVLHNDKSHITGWGEAGVPRYHTQFIAISGVVIFQSNEPSKLPLKTTKRGVDSSSHIYAVVKDRMREGIKMFTDFTNKWKNSPRGELVKHFSPEQTSSGPSITVSKMVDDKEWSNVRRDGGQVFKPKLPIPKDEDPTARVVFTKKKSEIDAVSEYLFEEKKTPSEVGEYCFDQILKRV